MVTRFKRSDRPELTCAIEDANGDGVDDLIVTWSKDSLKCRYAIEGRVSDAEPTSHTSLFQRDWRFIGSSRMRCPIPSKIALATARATVARPGSPCERPLGSPQGQLRVCDTWDLVAVETRVEKRRHDLDGLVIERRRRPSRLSLPPDLRTSSGLTTSPESIAVTTRRARTSCPSTASST
jgi:hypothetical protein